MKRIFALVAVAAGAAAACACARVEPYQRGNLARIERCEARDARARGLEAHMWMVREGAIGGYGKPGGGCGCN